jgi:hypothetical protein
MTLHARKTLALALLLAASSFSFAADPPGRDRQATALTGGRVIAAPGKVYDPGVVVLRGGVIEAVGPAGSTAIPADARVVDVKGKVVHAAFIDPYVSVDRLEGKPARRSPPDEEAGSTRRSRRAAAPESGPPVRAEQRVIEALSIKDDVADEYRRLGFAVVAAVPAAGVMRGRGAVVSLAEGPMPGRVLDPASGQYVVLEPEHDANDYPVSKMGAVAVARQAFLDAAWSRDASAAYAAKPSGQQRPRFLASSAALVPSTEGREVVVFEADDVLALLRANRFAKEMKLKARYVGAGDEYRLLPEVAAGRPDPSCASTFRGRTSSTARRSGSTCRSRGSRPTTARRRTRGGSPTRASSSRSRRRASKTRRTFRSASARRWSAGSRPTRRWRR